MATASVEATRDAVTGFGSETFSVAAGAPGFATAAAAAALVRLAAALAKPGAPAATENVSESKPVAASRVVSTLAVAKEVPAPVRADPAEVVSEAPVQETTERPANSRVKGQVKSKVADEPGAESEKSGRKPGRHPAPEAVEQADKPGS